MILDNKRHVCLAAAAFVTGVLIYCRPPAIWLCFSAFFGAVLFFTLRESTNRLEKWMVVCLSGGFLALACFLCFRQESRYDSILQQTRQDLETEFTGIVIRKEMKSESCLYYLKDTSYDRDGQTTAGGQILIYYDSGTVPVGSKVTAVGTIDLFPHASNDGQFDMADYYRSQNISFRVFADSIEILQFPKRYFRENLYQIQQKLSAVYQNELNTRDAGVLGTLVLGNKGLLEYEVKQMYQNAGISHILAISGLHISILGFGIYRFLRKCGARYLTAAIIGSVLVFCFTVMSGMGVSAQRALTMYLLIMGAEVLGRSYNSVNALACAALLILIRNPLALFSSGFVFSFMAMIGLTAFVPILTIPNDRGRQSESELAGEEKIAKRREKTKWDKLRQQILSGFILQLFMLPLTAWYYYEVPLYALFLNLLIIPLCSWLLGFGLLGGIAGLQFPLLSKWILVICHMILLIYEKAIKLTDKLPFSHVVTGKPSAWLVSLYFLVLCGCLILSLHIRASKGKASQLVIPVIFLAFLLFVPRKETSQMAFLDVGQGDGIYIADESGCHVMIDGGSSSEGEVGRYRIAPFLKYHGVGQVDFWIVTHGDEDHVSGLLELMEDGYPIRYLVLARNMPQTDMWKTLCESAGLNGTRVLFTEEGDLIQMEDLTLECLYPSDCDQSEDVNSLSQVWYLKADKMSALLTGDIGADQEKLLTDRGLVEHVTILKAAHHGSKNSSSENFLQAVSPNYTVISCGLRNRYGHPHAETIERIEEVESEILQTQYSGQITVYRNGENWILRAGSEP